MACVLGPIIQPSNNALFQSTVFPYSVPFQIGSSTPVNQFIVQISNNINFSIISGYVVASATSVSYINIDGPGIYYLRASCDGNTWTGITTFTVEEVAAEDLSTITTFTMILNNNQNGFIITVPQLRSGPLLGQNLLPTSSILNYLKLVEIEISTDSSFQTNTSRYYFNQEKFGQLYNMEILDIPNFLLTNSYFARLRLYNNQNNNWEPYTNFSVLYTGTTNGDI